MSKRLGLLTIVLAALYARQYMKRLLGDAMIANGSINPDGHTAKMRDVEDKLREAALNHPQSYFGTAAQQTV